MQVGNEMSAQSGAIIRYLARRGDIQGSSDAEITRNDMLVEEYKDILTAAYKVFAKVEKADAATKESEWTAFFAAGGPAQTQLQYLEKLVGANGIFSFGAKLNVGDVAVVCILNLLLGLEAPLLSHFPKLKAFYDKNHVAVLGKYINAPEYVVRT